MTDDILDALQDALDFIEKYEDVIDGDYGEPRPNEAMLLTAHIRAVMEKSK